MMVRRLSCRLLLIIVRRGGDDGSWVLLVLMLVLVVLRMVVMGVTGRRRERRLLLLAIGVHTLSRHIGMSAAAPTSSPVVSIFAVAALAAVRAATLVPIPGVLALLLLLDFCLPDRQFVYLDLQIVDFPCVLRLNIVQLLS